MSNTAQPYPEGIPTSPATLKALRLHACSVSAKQMRDAMRFWGLVFLLLFGLFAFATSYWKSGTINQIVTLTALCAFPLLLICIVLFLRGSGRFSDPQIIFGQVVSREQRNWRSHYCYIKLTRTQAFQIRPDGILIPTRARNHYEGYYKLYDHCGSLTPNLEVRLLCAPTGEAIDVIPVELGVQPHT